jgi:hypothetical protein
MNSTPLETSFSVERLKRHLQQHPEQASQLAIDYFQDFLNLARQYKQLQQDHQALQVDLILLEYEQPSSPPQLPHFLH